MRRTLLLILALALGGSAQESSPPLPELSVVQTWRDLLAQPSHEVEGLAEVRLGIESLSCPSHGQVLVYALVDGFNDPVDHNLGDRLGPLRVELWVEGEPRPRSGLEMQELVRALPPGGGRILYANALRLGELDAADIVVLGPAETPIARAAITAVERAHPWMPWPPEPVADSLSTEGRLGFAALPAWDGMRPLGSVPEDEEHPLPAEPKTPTEGVSLRVEGDSLHLRLPREVVTSRPHVHVLGRLWIDGEPWLPGDAVNALLEVTGRSRRGQELELPYRSILVLPEFATAREAGHSIEVQLLYCPHGWDFADSGSHLGMLHEIHDPPIHPMLSPRVKLTGN